MTVEQDIIEVVSGPVRDFAKFEAHRHWRHKAVASGTRRIEAERNAFRPNRANSSPSQGPSALENDLKQNLIRPVGPIVLSLNSSK